jgi:peptide/nickel transport system permease protein
MSGVLRRLVVSTLGIIGSTFLVFVLLRVLPGDLATAKLGIDATPEALQRLRSEYGLDAPLFTQYVQWLGNAIRGDFGSSLLSGDKVGSEIVSRLDVTLPLIGISSLLAVVAALWFGQRSALQRSNWKSVLLTLASQVGLAVPIVVLGIVAVVFFAVWLRILPAGGFPVDGWRATGSAIRSLVLPVAVLSMSQAAMLTRFARSEALDFVASDTYRTARAMGMTKHRALSTARQLLLVPVLGVLALQIATLIVGAVVVESVFALPGLGAMLVRDIAARDYLKVQGSLLVVTAIVFVTQFATGVLQERLDPRRRTS